MLVRRDLVLGRGDIGYLKQNWDHTIGVQSRIVLLAEAQRALLPVRHLLALANALLEHALGHFSKTNLRRQADLLVVRLNVDEVCE